MRYYLIAGEPSGDLHGSNLMKGILKADPQAEFRFWGGDKMADVGGLSNLVRHYKESSFMGFVEILRNLRPILGQIKTCKEDVSTYHPDVLILIDYAGFNLRMARFAHDLGISTFYYIAPKVWAWNESRIKQLRRYIDRLFVIFPFEVEYFHRHGIQAIYEGNPLMDSLTEQCQNLPSEADFRIVHGLDDRPIVALLAGSRKAEVKFNLPFMVELSTHFPQHQFVVAGVSWLDVELYNQLLAGSSVQYVQNATYELLSHSTAAVVTSGTATLETALLGVPEFVCYRAVLISMLIAKALIKIKYISLVNLVLNRESVRELKQFDMNMRNATNELRAILPGGNKRTTLLADYAELQQCIGAAGASDRFGAVMVKELKKELKKRMKS